MNIVLVTEKGELDFTELLIELKWAGERTAVARRVEFSIVSSPSDYFIPKLDIPLGSVIKVFDEGKEIFRGFVFSRERAYNGDSVTFVAYDGLVYWIKSKGVYNVKSMKVEDFARKLCVDTGTPVGDIAQTGIVFSRIFMGNTYYEMLQTAYTEAHKQNGKVYMPIMMNGKLSVIEKGKEMLSVVLTNFDPATREGNIMDSTFAESIENMISRVIIMDDKGNKVGTVEDKELIRLYGVIQEVYQKEKDTAPTPVAKSLLQGVERTASITALGITDFITGYAVKVKDEYTGLVGKFFIESDEHIWSNGVHTMTINLSFVNLMDEQDAGDTGE